MKILAVNKKATFDYEILDSFEAGIVLTGQEVKSAKEGAINMKGSFVSIIENEVLLKNCHISPYKMAGKLQNYDPTRPRRLLLHKKEIKNLVGKLAQKGLTLVPTKVYTKNNKVKVEFSLAKGKKKVDKRHDLKKKDIARDTARELKNRF